MHDLKYKAWLKDLKMIVEVSRINFDVTTVEVGLSTNEYLHNDYYEYEFDDIELLPYTGRNDDKGIELYKGDIVSVVDTHDGLAFVGYIDFQDCSYVIKNNYITGYNLMDYSLFKLGNIFENAELLEEKG